MVINNKAIFSTLAILLGLSLCLSTAAENFAYFAVGILSVFLPNIRKNITDALKNKYVLMCIVFYCLYILRFLIGDTPLSAYTNRLSKFAFWFFVPLFYVGIKSTKSGKFIILGFVIGAVVDSIISDLTFLFKHPLGIGHTDGMSLWVVFHGHLIHNLFLAIASSIILHVLLNVKLTNKQKFLLVICYLICVTNVMFIVFGRSGQIILLFTNIAVVIIRFGWRGVLSSVLATCIIIPLLYFTSPAIRQGVEAYQRDQQTISTSGNLEGNSTGLRKEFHKISLELFKNKPVVGYGSGMFESVYDDYAQKNNYYSRTSNPHCDWLLIGVEQGFVGIFVFAMLFLCLFVETVKLKSHNKNILMVVLIGYLLGSLQNSFFTDNVTGVAFIVLVIGLLLADGSAEIDNYKDKKLPT